MCVAGVGGRRDREGSDRVMVLGINQCRGVTAIHAINGCNRRVHI